MLGIYANNPTIDIYFRVPLGSLISSGLKFWANAPVKRIGPNTFVCGDRAVVIRYITPAELDQLNSRTWQKVFYVVDDDFWELETELSLPADYTARLRKFADDLLPGILEAADTIVSPSTSILAKFEGKQTLALDPAYTSISEAFDHFDRFSNIKVLFPGTRSHLADLTAISPALIEALEAVPDLSITTFLGEHGETALPSGPRVTHRRAQSWRQFRQTMRSERYHLALVPYSDTAFNRARSINKIHDVAAFGAVGLYSNRPPSSDVVRDGETGLLLGDAPEDWTAALIELAGQPSAMRSMAEANAAVSRKLGDPERVRRFWCQRLQIPHC